MKTETVNKIIDTLNDSVNEILIKEVFLKVESERVNKYIQPIFDKYNFKSDNSKIINDNYLYLCKDENKLNAYFTECDNAHKKHGFYADFGTCPILVAKQEILKSKHKLVKLAAPFFNFTFDEVIVSNLYDEIVDNLIKLVVNHPNYRKAKI